MTYHPLLVPELKSHYNSNLADNLIDFEQSSTIEKALGVTDFNIIMLDTGKEIDTLKLETFKAWRELLKDLLEIGYDRSHNLRHAMISEFPETKYSLGA